MGAQRVLEYDERGNVVRETDPQGRVVVRTFDARNNRLTETEPYDPASPPDPIPTTTYAYDSQDNLLRTTDALGHDDGYTYNATRQVLTTNDARNNTTTNAYDAKGNLLTTTRCPRQHHELRLRRPRQRADADGHASTASPQITGYEYDSYGRLKKETDPTGHATSYTYDTSGNRLTQTTTRTVYACTTAAAPVCSASGSETLTTTPHLRPATAASRPRRTPTAASRARSTTTSAARSRATTSATARRRTSTTNGPSRPDHPPRQTLRRARLRRRRPPHEQQGPRRTHDDLRVRLPRAG